MKPSTLIQRLVAPLSATRTLTSATPPQGRFAILTTEKDNTQNNNNNNSNDIITNPPFTLSDATLHTDTFPPPASWPNSWKIPVSHSACTSWALPAARIRSAIGDIITWGDTPTPAFPHPVPKLIEPRTWHLATVANATAYVCNCKWEHYDPVPADEMWEFYYRLVAMCGHGQSGWLFSKKWDKGFAVAATDWVEGMKPQLRICPPYCCGEDSGKRGST
ncbi:uncharacterized protein GGS25DRAFT_519582 [Hypoxylon fragiforme]|uniref:uncharacterized protein n=1 Tax=Hypoxylon fragiforme TaxID=63214 RepID=UPI0020C6A4D0|nr:uncharacterized protein GGS25DRAFT_519582 [Hypoxylon fragiforme]KAI2611280.1 hypothetical protein GGS25DRAFT_519582 [Hypoxylon fragiforme]